MIKSVKKFRTLFGFGTLFLMTVATVGCKDSLSEKRAMELVRLNYRQQSLTQGAGSWLLDTIEISTMTRLKDSVPGFRVIAYTRGLYQLPVIEDAPQGYSEKFFDTIQFVAKKYKEVWMADDWVIIGSRHE